MSELREAIIDEFVQFGAQCDFEAQLVDAIIDAVIAALPHYEGGAGIGRNYWSGQAKGRNEVLDEIKAILRAAKEAKS